MLKTSEMSIIPKLKVPYYFSSYVLLLFKVGKCTKKLNMGVSSSLFVSVDQGGWCSGGRSAV